jgi:hypothetical protein
VEDYRGTNKMATFKDGSVIEDGSFAGATAVDVFTLIQAKAFLGLEIRTNLRMKMSRAGTALNLAENISGLNFGRGIKGREKALVWVEAELARIEDEERID